MTGFWIGAALLALGALALLYRRRRGWPAMLIGVVAVAAAVALYLAVGSWRPESQSEAEKKARSEIAALQDAARAHPGDGAAWLRLGQEYLSYEQFRLAETALRTANRLYDGRNASAMAALAETLALDADTSNDAQVAPLFDQVLQIEPRNPKALFYTGLKALHEGQLQLARDRFSAMLGPEVPPDVESALQKQIAQLDAEMAAGKNTGKAVARAEGGVDAATAVSIEVTVAAPLRAAFEAKAKAGAPLFVFVRNPAGGPPLAVKRLVASLPLKIVLSANDAMMAGNAIKPHQQVQVAARLSSSGTPTASAGDLYGEALATAGSNQPVSISISQIAR